MAALTLTVAVVVSVIIWSTRPIVGLAAYVGMICLYPQYLAVSVGPIALTSGRIVIVVLLIRILASPLDKSLLRLRWIDVFTGLSFAGAVVASLTNETFMRVVEREGGHFTEVILPYLAARLTLRSREDVFILVRGLLLAAIPLALVGLYQSITGHNPYGWMRAYSPFGLWEQEVSVRKGLYRADASFGNKIPFGLFFAMMLCLNCAVYFYGRRRLLPFLCAQGFMLLGLISSMSSAPLFALVTSVAFIACYPFRRAWPYFVISFVAVCAVIEIASDQRFYEVLTRFALNSATAWYRINLFEEAFGGGMSGHWLTGYGYVGFAPGEYGHNGFFWNYPDLVNLYIAILARTGLVGLGSYLLLNVHYYWCLYRGGRIASHFSDRWAVWCISGGLVGWNIAMMTVGALDQISSLFYILIAITGAIPWILREGAAVQPVPEPERRGPVHGPVLSRPARQR